MKWDKDEYKDLKHEIWELLRKGINEHHGKYITVKKLHDSIDELFDTLINDDKPAESLEKI